MKFLLLEIWGYLLFAFLLGMFVQWFFCCRNKKGKINSDTAPLMGVAITPEVSKPKSANDTTMR